MILPTKLTQSPAGSLLAGGPVSPKLEGQHTSRVSRSQLPEERQSGTSASTVNQIASAESHTVPSNSFFEVATETLQDNVFRLVDPESGETSCVGRGQGDRVFQHVGGSIRNAGMDELDPKFSRINQIQAEGLEVQHIIHRHGWTRTLLEK